MAGHPAERARRAVPARITSGSVTVSDVASLAGVSTATVSRALNTPELVRDEAREKVLAAVATLGYIPNESARALRQSQTRLVGVVVPTLKYALYATFFEELQLALARQGFFALLTTSDYDLAVEAEQARKLIMQGAQGLVLVGGKRKPELRNFLAATRIPYVSTYSFDPDDPAGTIGFDNARAVEEAVDYLVSLGHARIAMLSGFTRNDNDRAGGRAAGFRTGLAKHRLPGAAEMAEAAYTIEGGRAALAELLDHGSAFTAVVCGSDMLAFGAMVEAKARGLRIPRDLSIIGFDDLDFAAHLDPALSTVGVPSVELGRAAAAHIIALCSDATVPLHGALPTRLILRETTAPPKRKAARVSSA